MPVGILVSWETAEGKVVSSMTLGTSVATVGAAVGAAVGNLVGREFGAAVGNLVGREFVGLLVGLGTLVTSRDIGTGGSRAASFTTCNFAGKYWR